VTWAVVLRTGDQPDQQYLYGPIDDEAHAERFAEYLTKEVDPAHVERMHSPLAEMLRWHQYESKRLDAGLPAPEHWPPLPGDIWQDKDGNRWTCSAEQHTANGRPYLVCLAFTADDSADEINRKYGPMRLVYRPDVREYEVPF
jgi:hypothetical protein